MTTLNKRLGWIVADYEELGVLTEFGAAPTLDSAWPGWRNGHDYLESEWSADTLKVMTMVAQAATAEGVAAMDYRPRRLLERLLAGKVLPKDHTYPPAFRAWFEATHAAWYAEVDAELYRFAFGVAIDPPTLPAWTEYLNTMTATTRHGQGTLHARLTHAVLAAYARSLGPATAPPFEEVHP